MDKIPQGNEIRQQFIDFFVSKGHTAVRSASLVPAGDQTILFTNAGMVQFKDVFLGTDVRPYTRACDAQKCMRVAGKHNDLDDVGRDDSHHTFFEMLGNWSFGDYYKKEAIEWAWELLTDVWKLDKSKLWSTCFKDNKNEIPADEEAFNYWVAQPGIDPSHVLYFGRKENFWEMAETGPCGPCSEIHIDLGPDRCNMKDVPGHVCHVNGDCSRFLELWNLVFIQYNRLSEESLVPLAQHFVDTGMGFERIVSMLQGKNSNYKTDLFMPMIQEIQRLSNTTDEQMMANFTPYRVIADHARAATFLIADGVIPGNIGRNYICRMIIRRAVRFGQQIGLSGGFMDQIAQVVIDQYSEAYPELARMRESILHSIKWEEERFNKTLENGINHLNEVIAEMKSVGKTMIDGANLFDLYSTHGLPLEITYDIVRDLGFNVDRAGFNQANNAHRIASGAGKAIGKMGGEEAEQYGLHLSYLKETGKLSADGVICDPYTSGPLPAKLLMALVDGQRVDCVEAGMEAELIADRTNFYLEMGGQVGDTGIIRGVDEAFEFEVREIRRPLAGMTVHSGVMKKGAVIVGEEISVQVDVERRRDIMRNHTATHLLHAALRQVIGEQARQAGSLVDAEHLRFDFNCNRALTSDELAKVEEIVNQKILDAIPVNTKIESLDQAMDEGVTAIFNEKYGEIVRVVRVGSDTAPYSAELCGGTHVGNTSEIGSFLITSEGSIATGVRRIEAITGREANLAMRKGINTLRGMATRLNVSVDVIRDKVELLQTFAAKLQKETVDLRTLLVMKDFAHISDRIQKVQEAEVLAVMVPNAEVDTLRTLADKIKGEHENVIVVLSTVANDQVIFIASVSDTMVKRGISAGDIVKSISQIVDGKGGGRPNMAQGGGKNVDKAQEALDAVAKFVRTKLGA